MIAFPRLLAPLALLLAAASPGTTPANETQAMLAALQAMDGRVASIGHRLAVAGAVFCSLPVSRAGFVIHDLGQYAPEFRPDAVALFGLGAEPAVLAVVPDSAAARAGLRAGDAILGIGGRSVPGGSEDRGGKATFARVAAIEPMIEAALAMGDLALTIERGGSRHELAIAGDRGCATSFQVQPGTRLNASADGRYVKLSSAVVDFTRGDDELALIVAHEFAHNILGHRDALDAQGVSRGLFRAFGKNPGRIRATENEADRLALHLMARAGFDIRVAPAFWDRFGRETDAGIFSDRTHSGRRERIALARTEIALIEAQRLRGEPPTPDFGQPSPPASPR